MSEKLTAIAIDDEKVALKIVGSLVEQTDFIELIGSYQSSVEGANAVIENEPDILFLDVEMPDMSGIDILKTLPRMPEIILVTSKKEYALEAFEFEVTDYLLKPIESYARFLKAVTRAREHITQKHSQPPAGTNKDNIFIKVDSLLVNIDLKELHFVEAYGDYVKVVMADGKSHVVYNRLKNVQDRLPTEDFVRVHRSYIVRLDQIRNIDQTNLEIGKKIVPISHTYRNELLARINKL